VTPRTVPLLRERHASPADVAELQMICCAKNTRACNRCNQAIARVVLLSVSRSRNRDVSRAAIR
jgi:hypothetical protein